MVVALPPKRQRSSAAGSRSEAEAGDTRL